MLPDADVMGFTFSIPYEDEWGHRGATHSLAFSFGVGLVIGIGTQRFGLRGVRTGLIVIDPLAQMVCFSDDRVTGPVPRWIFGGS